MNYKNLHKWEVSPKEAIRLQKTLAKEVVFGNKKLKKIKKIAGADVSFGKKRCCAAVCVFSYPDLELVEEKTAVTKITFPYIPTLFTFREGPPILEAFRKIKNIPDLVLFDGQGRAHPRKIGLATHIGVWLKTPTIGCAKTPLYGKFTMPKSTKGSYAPIKDKKLTIGAVIRTKDKTKPLFVSQGYKVSLQDSIKFTLGSCTKYRMPEVLRAAHTLSKITLSKKVMS